MKRQPTPPEHLQTYLIPYQVLRDILLLTDGDIPRDVDFLAVINCPASRSLEVVLQHESFPEVYEGGTAPRGRSRLRSL